MTFFSGMAEDPDETYASYWDEFKLRTDEKQKTVEFLKTLQSCDLSVITNMISIGAGKDARLDVHVIQKWVSSHVVPFQGPGYSQ